MTKLRWHPLKGGMLLATIPFLFLVLWRWGDPPGASDGDYAQYLLHAKAIVEGRPYSDIGFIYSDFNFVGPQTQPPGWPLVLAPFVMVFGISLPVFKGLVTVLTAGFAVVAGLYFARRSSPGVGVTVAAITMLGLQSQGATSSAISDPLFCLLVWVTLTLAGDKREWTWGRSLLVALLSIATMLVRVAGIALLPALLLYSLFTLRKHRWHVALVIAGVVALGVAVVAVTDLSIPFLERLRLGDKLSARQFQAMLGTYQTSYLTGTLYPFATDRLNDVYHVAVIPFVAIGAVRFFRTEARSPAAFFTLSYIALLWVAPVRESRYAWPLIPVLIYCLALGWLWVAGFVARTVASERVVRRVSAVAVALLCIASAVVAIRSPRWLSLHGEPTAMELFSYVRTMASSTPVRVVFENPRVLTLETGAPAMGVPTGSDTLVLAELKSQRITHVVIRTGETRDVFNDDDLERIVRSHPLEFPLLFNNATFSVHAVRTLDSITPPAGAEPNERRLTAVRVDFPQPTTRGARARP